MSGQPVPGRNGCPSENDSSAVAGTRNSCAQDAAHSGRGALERFDERGVIVRLDLEGASPSVADVDDAGVFTRALHDAAAARRQTLQMHAR